MLRRMTPADKALDKLKRRVIKKGVASGAIPGPKAVNGNGVGDASVAPDLLGLVETVPVTRTRTP